ncbi:hypothetical protein D3C84_865810 [compost metagenome]
MKIIISFSVMSSPLSAQALSIFSAFRPSLAICMRMPSCERVSRSWVRATLESSTSSTSRPTAICSKRLSRRSADTRVLIGTISASTFSTSMISTICSSTLVMAVR